MGQGVEDDDDPGDRKHQEHLSDAQGKRRDVLIPRVLCDPRAADDEREDDEEHHDQLDDDAHHLLEAGGELLDQDLDGDVAPLREDVRGGEHCQHDEGVASRLFGPGRRVVEDLTGEDLP